MLGGGLAFFRFSLRTFSRWIVGSERGWKKPGGGLLFTPEERRGDRAWVRG